MGVEFFEQVFEAGLDLAHAEQGEFFRDIAQKIMSDDIGDDLRVGQVAELFVEGFWQDGIFDMMIAGGIQNAPGEAGGALAIGHAVFDRFEPGDAEWFALHPACEPNPPDPLQNQA